MVSEKQGSQSQTSTVEMKANADFPRKLIDSVDFFFHWKFEFVTMQAYIRTPLRSIIFLNSPSKNYYSIYLISGLKV